MTRAPRRGAVPRGRSSGSGPAARAATARVAALLWSLPNTLAGLAFGALGLPFGARAARTSGALAFLRHPLMLRRGAVTLGHVVCYGRDCGPASPLAPGVTLADHEAQHVRQSERLGPLYFPAHAWFGLLALIRDGSWHGPSNRLERGPLATPPRPWA